MAELEQLQEDTIIEGLFLDSTRPVLADESMPFDLTGEKKHSFDFTVRCGKWR